MPKKPTGGSVTKRQTNPRPGPGAKGKALGRPTKASASTSYTATMRKKAAFSPREKAAAKTVRRVTRAAVRKGISGPTEDSLGITRQEGGRKIRRAVKTLGYDKAMKVATKTRLRKGQTYKGGVGWVTKKSGR